MSIPSHLTAYNSSDISLFYEISKKDYSFKEKLCFLAENDRVKAFFAGGAHILSLISSLSEEEEYYLKTLVAMGQEHIFDISAEDEGTDIRALLKKLFSTLRVMESFYNPIGGVIGYHTTLMNLISTVAEEDIDETERYYCPEGSEISTLSPETHTYILAGIRNLPSLAEIYVVGGAGDRLGLVDEETGAPLPAARLPFKGKTLIEDLLDDLKAREYLYHKIYGKHIVTPLVLMTSEEKDNHTHILEICEENKWFGRPRDSFFFCIQPLVPIIADNGMWALKGSLDLMVKPGGHGALWKLALDTGAMAWLKGQGRTKALVRQINNPVAGTDYGLCAFTGKGFKENKAFGFSSCYRAVGSAEGVNVIREHKEEDIYTYALTNIEYTDFTKKGVVDAPMPGTEYSRFPSNTNILFADLETVKEQAEKNPLPGMLVNMKTEVVFHDENGGKVKCKGGRLESTMQNIADSILEKSSQEIPEGSRDAFKTYITYNERRKTISVTKHLLEGKGEYPETPEGCFHDIQGNNIDLLLNYCKIQTPELSPPKEYFSDPEIIFLYNPMLGPIYSIIASKMQGGVFHKGAEMQIEIAEVDIKKITLDGSCIIKGDEESRCRLHNVTIENKGIDTSAQNSYWKNEISRHECCCITLHGDAEFYAAEITLKGEINIDVPAGHRMTAYRDERDEIAYSIEEISEPSWQWEYKVNDDDSIAVVAV
jgi:UTP---glucose-1-phosphate uridylyltransferase